MQIVRLIGQHLCDVGLRTSADILMKEAWCRLDQPTAATFRHCVMKGDWTGAVNVLENLAEHLEDKSAHIEMKFILLEKKYLENLNSCSSLEALRVLQLELTLSSTTRAGLTSWRATSCWARPRPPPRPLPTHPPGPG